MEFPGGDLEESPHGPATSVLNTFVLGRLSEEGQRTAAHLSLIHILSTFAGQYAEVLNKGTNRPVVVCDRDHVIAVAGVSKKEYLERLSLIHIWL